MRLVAVFADHGKLWHATVDDGDASATRIQQFSPVNNNLLTCTYQKRFLLKMQKRSDWRLVM